MANKVVITVQTTIRATRARIWGVITGPDCFRDWCSVFNEGTYYEGDWSPGSTLRFLGPDPKGGTGGMISRVAEHNPGEFIRFEHIGVISQGIELDSGPIYEEWIPTFEEYRLEGGPESFTLTIRQELPEKYADHFAKTWPKALDRIREMAESSAP